MSFLFFLTIILPILFSITLVYFGLRIIIFEYSNPKKNEIKEGYVENPLKVSLGFPLLLLGIILYLAIINTKYIVENEIAKNQNSSLEKFKECLKINKLVQKSTKISENECLSLPYSKELVELFSNCIENDMKNNILINKENHGKQ